MRNFVLIILSLLLIISCTSKKEIQKSVYPNLFDGKYDSEFPYRSSSQQLEEISNTIRLVNSIAFYRTYYFDQNMRMTISGVKRGEHERYAYTSTTFEETASGTGTIIYNSGMTVGVLTCSHIINYPDSIAVYYYDQNGNNTGLLKSISIIKKRSIYVVPFEEDGDFTVVVENPDFDIALLKKELATPMPVNIKTFNFALGKAKELEWGTFVYAFGFPINYKMISKAIVSSPNLDGKGSFLIDAIFNQGFSGGIVLAIRDGVPNFELVGMVKSVPAEYDYFLKPKEENDIVVGTEYTKTPLVGSRANIKYGVTKIIAIESILNFLEENSNQIESNGFIPSQFFK